MSSAELKKNFTQVANKFRKLGIKKAEPVLEQAMFLILQKDIPGSRAKSTLEKLRKQYVDWNELRVSSVPELAKALEPLKDNQNLIDKVQRLKEFVNQVFNTKHSLNLESLREQPIEEQAKFFLKLECLEPEEVEGLIYCLTENAPSNTALAAIRAQIKQTTQLLEKPKSRVLNNKSSNGKSKKPSVRTKRK